MKKIIVFFAEGFEEIEGLTVVDILRRAGVQVDMVSITDSRQVCGSHHIKIETDYCFGEAEISDADMIVLPGGMPGTLNLQNHSGVIELLKDFDQKGKYVAAICAAPSVLGGIHLLDGKKACCYPSFEKALNTEYVVYDPTVQDGNIITGRGMGAAIPFALKLVEVLCGKEKSDEIGESIVFPSKK